VADGGKRAVSVKTANGHAACLGIPGDVSARIRDRNVILGVRPEHITRFDAHSSARRPGTASLVAPVELVEPTGAETIAVMQLGGLEIVGRFDRDQAPHLGEEIQLGIDMARACLFDPETTKLI